MVMFCFKGQNTKTSTIQNQNMNHLSPLLIIFYSNIFLKLITGAAFYIVDETTNHDGPKEQRKSRCCSKKGSNNVTTNYFRHFLGFASINLGMESLKLRLGNLPIILLSLKCINTKTHFYSI